MTFLVQSKGHISPKQCSSCDLEYRLSHMQNSSQRYKSSKRDKIRLKDIDCLNEVKFILKTESKT